MPPDPILRAALQLAELGLALHWLLPPGAEAKGRDAKPGKSPVHARWQKRSLLTPSELRAEWRPGFNLGLRTGYVSGARFPLVAVDCDDDAAIRWAAASLPYTPLHAETRQGAHLFFALPPEGGVATRQGVAGLHLDVRGTGGNLVLAPSIHPSGYVYRWAHAPTEAMLRALPVVRDEMFPTAEPARKSAPVVSSLPPRTVTADAIERARRWLAKRDPAVSGQAGHTWTYGTALYVLNAFELDEAAALHVLQEWNARCDPPWSEAELLRKVREATKARLQLGRLPPSRGAGA